MVLQPARWRVKPHWEIQGCVATAGNPTGWRDFVVDAVRISPRWLPAIQRSAKNDETCLLVLPNQFMNQHLNSALIFALVTGAGILAIKLPYRYNPFRLTSVIARGLSERVQMVIPKVIGWGLIAVGGLGFLLLLLMFVGLGLKAIGENQRRAGAERLMREFQMSEESLAQQVGKFVQEADDFELWVQDPKTGKYDNIIAEDRAGALVRIKEAFGSKAMVLRTDPATALFFGTPKVVSFKRKNVVTGQVRFAGDLSAITAVIPGSDTLFQCKVPPEAGAKLVVALPQLERDGEKAAALEGGKPAN